MTGMWSVKAEDFRPIDFQSGHRLALASGEMRECQCCGKKISKGSWTNTGHLLGSECAMSINMLNWHPMTQTDESWRCTLGIGPKQFAFYQAGAA